MPTLTRSTLIPLTTAQNFQTSVTSCRITHLGDQEKLTTKLKPNDPVNLRLKQIKLEEFDNGTSFAFIV